MKVVTGATGYIGGVLARALAERGDPVRAIYHRRPRFEGRSGIEWVAGDILDQALMVNAFRGADVVFHLAAAVSIDPRKADMVRATNVAGTRKVVAAALECGVRRFVHLSSIHAFDQSPRDEALDETRGRGGDALATRGRSGGAPRTVYDSAKALAEEEVRRGMARGLDAVIVNPTGVIGPYDAGPTDLGQFFIDLHRQHLPMLVDGGFDFVDVRDVAEATLAAESKGRRGENYILSGEWHSTVELARFAEAETGVPAPRLVCPIRLARIWAPIQASWDRSRGRRVRFTRDALAILENSNRCTSSAKAKKELGFAPRPTEESVRDAYRWFAAHGKLAG